MPHGDGARADQLDVNAAVVHELQMALLRDFELLVGHFEFSIGRVLRNRLREKLAKHGRRCHVTVNVDGDLSVMHNASLFMCGSFLFVRKRFLFRHAWAGRYLGRGRTHRSAPTVKKINSWLQRNHGRVSAVNLLPAPGLDVLSKLLFFPATIPSARDKLPRWPFPTGRCGV